MRAMTKGSGVWNKQPKKQPSRRPLLLAELLEPQTILQTQTPILSQVGKKKKKF